MTLTNTLRIAGFSMLLFACAGIAAAQGTTANASLAMSATVQTAVELNISTGTGATVGGTAGSGSFTINFGNVNGLGVGTPEAGVSVVADSTGALYSSPIDITPIFTGFATGSATVSKTAGAAANQAMAREGSTALNMIVPTTKTTAFAGAATGSTNVRYVGFRIAHTDVAGAKAATILYDVIID